MKQTNFIDRLVEDTLANPGDAIVSKVEERTDYDDSFSRMNESIDSHPSMTTAATDEPKKAKQYEQSSEQLDYIAQQR